MKNPEFKKVLAIETSCDDTSVSIVGHDGYVFSVVCATQDSDHEVFGGIVPEIASRNHSHHLLPLVELCLERAKLAWDDIDGIAVTCQPGLIGALLVGIVTAKTLAFTKNKPLIGVNHLEGHLLAPFLKDDNYAPPEGFSYPYIALAVSGGHTSLYKVNGLGEYEILGSTIDDAAGEAFDKFAKVAGLGFPGGVKVDKHAQNGNTEAFNFPRTLVRKGNFNFSFSGLKTAGQKQIRAMSEEDRKNSINDLCASYQEAIVDSLLIKMKWAVKEFLAKNETKRAIITGGVSANSRLRAKALEWAQEKSVELVVPPIRYCTDNAAMIGYAGIQRLNRGERSNLELGASPKSTILEQACTL